MCGSTCFGRLPAYHQEHATALGAYERLVGRGLAGYEETPFPHNLPDHDQQRSSRFPSTVKPEAPSADVCS
jgi:hypothetical protein